MSKLNLSQRWVDRLTADASDDPEVIGATSKTSASQREVDAIFERVAMSDAASEMVRRKWFQPTPGEGRAGRVQPLRQFLFTQSPNRPSFGVVAHFRRQAAPKAVTDEMTIFAWLCRVADEASQRGDTHFDPSRIDETALAQLVQLSVLPTGPIEALRLVESWGIRVVIENTLPGMRTDGASLMIRGQPIIGLTLRHDRLDSFWFTLLHELAHILLHLSNDPSDVYVDVLEDEPVDAEVEAEADAFAKDAFVPRDAWFRSDAYRLATEGAIVSLAKRFGIHPAIVAGRLRFERRQFQAFTNLIGFGEVRNQLLAG